MDIFTYLDIYLSIFVLIQVFMAYLGGWNHGTFPTINTSRRHYRKEINPIFKQN